MVASRQVGSVIADRTANRRGLLLIRLDWILRNLIELHGIGIHPINLIRQAFAKRRGNSHKKIPLGEGLAIRWIAVNNSMQRLTMRDATQRQNVASLHHYYTNNNLSNHAYQSSINPLTSWYH